jgi:tetratricopeptide (TPR) repeat protein
MRLAAYHHLVEIHRARDDRGALEGTVARLIATGDDALTAMGHRLQGDLAREDGRMSDARSAYDTALRAFPHDSKAQQSRAALAAEMGDIDAAIRDLAALAPRDAAPRAAIEGLEALRARSDRAEILRWLGFAQFEVGEFEGSDANLAAYLELVPGDVEAGRWLGLSLISIQPDAEDGNGQDLQRLVRGLDELARAAAAGDAEGRDAFLWLLDRLMVAGERFLWAIGGSRPVADALPEVRHVLDMLSRAQNFVTPSRDWAAGVAALTECIDAATALGLRCCATCWQATAADWLLLMGRLEEARQHAPQMAVARLLS